MIKLIVFLSCLIPLTLFAQVDIRNISLSKSDLNLLYVGVDNEIKVRGIEFDSSYILTSSSGKVAKGYNNEILVRVDRKGIDTLRIHFDNKLIFLKVFEKRNIFDPIAHLGSIIDTVTTVDEILENPILFAKIPDCYYEIRCKVNSYIPMFIKNPSDTIKTFKRVIDNELNKEAIEIIKKLKPGDKIVFNEIIVQCHSSVNRVLSPLTFTIK